MLSDVLSAGSRSRRGGRTCGGEVPRESGDDPDATRRAWLSPSGSGQRSLTSAPVRRSWPSKLEGSSGTARRLRYVCPPATAARPSPLPVSGTRIEVDLHRQVALLVRGRTSSARSNLHRSFGTPSRRGDFRVYRNERRSWSVRSRCGSWASTSPADRPPRVPEVPTYPASHGCVRFPPQGADRLCVARSSSRTSRELTTSRAGVAVLPLTAPAVSDWQAPVAADAFGRASRREAPVAACTRRGRSS